MFHSISVPAEIMTSQHISSLEDLMDSSFIRYSKKKVDLFHLEPSPLSENVEKCVMFSFVKGDQQPPPSQKRKKQVTARNS